ncbi:DUF721 domain-containing protein [Capnocytophaga stomatis]|uniref:DUF721 domain-containing protein n=1 Tax=Capnocytophaga stomatis TaxID=1848904 RepID=A0A250FUR7_9FLAO|nr:DUF721 domain-containing protein [Capnocytophaga stomatis]ATA88804.1 RNA-binding protein [Capnocytophaga stomatis]GIJ95256.1 hypothetical protein CAPN002_24740 [Capnocytophaga stomatis]GIJ97007.1 hypothetical protein CAPN001_15760 [Capnocytophaga stomatis]GIM50510.1 hypothetical protein CAPN003_19620 [Capnocytophaga stomatis]
MEGNTQLLSSVIKQLIKQNRLEYGLHKVEVQEIWNRLMGNAIVKYTTSVELKGDVLYVQLSSPALCQELGYGKEKIVALINEELGEEIVKKLHLTS